MKLKKVIKTLFIFFSFQTVFALENISINYLGVFSENTDSNMSKMTSDKYFAQLQELPGCIITDMTDLFEHSELPDTKKLTEDAFYFYVTVSKNDDEQWLFTLHLVNISEAKFLKKSIIYDSYYKIYNENKKNIKNYINDLYNDKKEDSQELFSDEILQTSYMITSTESLSGTWKGEDNIEKIVILRGGRGFIIFKNGATMNVTISFEASEEKQNIVILQKGKSNASYFPELPRKEALSAALTADPIKWTLTALNDSTLIGNKNTIIDSNGDIISDSINVEWKKID